MASLVRESGRLAVIVVFLLAVPVCRGLFSQEEWTARARKRSPAVDSAFRVEGLILLDRREREKVLAILPHTNERQRDFRRAFCGIKEGTHRSDFPAAVLPHAVIRPFLGRSLQGRVPGKAVGVMLVPKAIMRFKAGLDESVVARCA